LAADETARSGEPFLLGCLFAARITYHSTHTHTRLQEGCELVVKRQRLLEIVSGGRTLALVVGRGFILSVVRGFALGNPILCFLRGMATCSPESWKRGAMSFTSSGFASTSRVHRYRGEIERVPR
jgi:hypothetical protein